MIILTIKTDQEIAELGLFNLKSKLEYINWQAHRELSVTIHKKAGQLLTSKSLDWHDIQAIVFYEGPGSFTGLRIGASVANALASSLNVPIAQSSGDKWIDHGINQLQKNKTSRLVTPKYSSLPKITKPRK